jgi:hypothetical protein
MILPSTLSLVNTIEMLWFKFEVKFETIPGSWWLGGWVGGWVAGKELIIRLAKATRSWS